MLNIKDLLQLTRHQKVVISCLLTLATVIPTLYVIHLFVQDLNNPLVAVVFPAVQYLWIVLSVWGAVLLIGQGDSPGRIISLADEFLEKIFPESFGILRFINNREGEIKSAITDALFKNGGNAQTKGSKWNYQVNHHKGAPFANYKFSIINNENIRRPSIRLFLHINQTKVTLIYYYFLKEDEQMSGSNANLYHLLEKFLEVERAFGYQGSLGKSCTDNVNVYALSLTTELADGFLNSGKLKLALSHDVAMMTHALLHQIESDPKLSKDLMNTMKD